MAMSLGKRNKIFIGIIAVAIVFAIVWSCFYKKASFPDIPEDKWQAVFLENNQVYFGKLSHHDRGYVTLTQVYYLRGAGQGEAANTQAVDLVKLGGEFHGPEDLMFIPKEKIVFWENLKSDSQVVKLIQKSSKR